MTRAAPRVTYGRISALAPLAVAGGEIHSRSQIYRSQIGSDIGPDAPRNTGWAKMPRGKAARIRGLRRL
ncbi:MAG: hypothetical protein Q7J57_06100 [Gemmobacter sp.]|nr:hypothetical protein [Gemmobacter sp.]